MEQNELVSELEKLSEEIERVLLELAKRHLYEDEAYALMSKIDKFLSENLKPDSKEFRIYDKGKGDISPRPSQFGYRPRYVLEKSAGSQHTYAGEEEKKKLEQWRGIIREILNHFSPEFLRNELREKIQFFFPSDDAYRAKSLFWGIMKKAKSKLAVIDEYLDDEIFNYVESLDESIVINLLTGNRKKIFKTLYDALKIKRGNIEARENQDCHDRFLIIDDAQIWHSGNSFSGVGKKAFQINRLLDDAEREKFLKCYADWWKNGISI